MIDIEVICRAYTETATEIWAERGRINPSLWALGRNRFVLAKPVPSKAYNDIRFRTVLHSMMAQAVEATVLGMTDETWVQQRPVGATIPRHGDLAALAETDPTVHTAIISQAVDTSSLNGFLAMARLELDDNGGICWHYQTSDRLEGAMADALHYAAGYVGEDLDRAALDNYAEAMGWRLLEGETE